MTSPPRLTMVYQVFHVFMIHRYISHEFYVISYDSLELDLDLTYEEELVAILDRQIRWLKTKEIDSVKIK